MKLNKKSLIIFDIDGTITDSVKIHQKAFVEALHDLGITNMDSNFKAYKHHTDSYIAKVIFENDTKEEFTNSKIREFEAFLMKRMSDSKISEILGAKKLIDYLKSKTEFAISYATGSLKKPAEFKLNAIGIDYAKEQLVASNNIFERENIVLQAIKNASVFYGINNFERIISVGDGLWDLKTANNLNIEFIGIGKSNKDILSENGMKYYFDNLEDFKVI
jgi:phosphoglycolate phosphatase-like HAD superfamily hydrolase